MSSDEQGRRVRARRGATPCENEFAGFGAVAVTRHADEIEAQRESQMAKEIGEDMTVP